jgi:putative pyruvate formate lyase activating enzyme
MGTLPVVARVAPHYGEETCISGTRGSGTVFFSGCTMRCKFCQNYEISSQPKGLTMTPDMLAECYKELEKEGVHNINLVTAGHFIPHVAASVAKARAEGLSIPVAYNSGGYESVESLKMLDGLIDIYMPDMKFVSSSLSGKLCGARDYFEVCCKALDEMYRQTGPAVIDDNGLMKRGIIVRHLMLPGQLFDTKKVLDYLCGRYGNNIYISLMNQYTPFEYRYPDMKLPVFLQRKLPQGHYAAAAEYLSILGQENAFLQDDASGDELLPDFKT